MSRKRLTAAELEQKNYNDSVFIDTYKKQLNRLAQLISEREARIERRKPIIEKIHAREVAEFQAKVETAKARANKSPLQVGKSYSMGADVEMGGTCVTVANARDLYLLLLPSGRSVLSGKDLVYLSEMFFIEYPGAFELP